MKIIGTTLMVLVLLGIGLSGWFIKPCKITHYRPRTDIEIINCQSACHYSCQHCFEPIGVCE